MCNFLQTNKIGTKNPCTPPLQNVTVTRKLKPVEIYRSEPTLASVKVKILLALVMWLHIIFPPLRRGAYPPIL